MRMSPQMPCIAEVIFFFACSLGNSAIFKGIIMDHSISQPLMTSEGVAFTVRVDSLDRECLITAEALHELSRLKATDIPPANMMEVFHAFEATINGVARRLVFARVPGTPLRLGPNTFLSPPHTN